MVYFLPVVAEDPVLQEVGEIPVLPLQPQPNMVLQHLQTREKKRQTLTRKSWFQSICIESKQTFSIFIYICYTLVLYMLFLRRKKVGVLWTIKEGNA
jgi:hypothetical protein